MERSSQKLLIIVAGPTAVGKTALAIELAKFFGSEIISADSRQFYKEISIGTAKPSPSELAQVKHHFIDSHSIKEEYSAGKYEKDVLMLLEELFIKKDICIMVGGSGLFVQAVASGFDELPDINPKIRSDLNEELSKTGLEPLLRELEERDLAYYNLVDRANPQRIIRALEIIRGTGVPYSTYRKRSSKPRPFKILKIGLEKDRKELYKRIDLRVDQMIVGGLLQEVQSVVVFKNQPALKTVGYSEIFDYLDGKFNWETTVNLIKQNSRRYAKRQLTWFKKDPEFIWFEPIQIEEIKILIIDKLKSFNN